MAKLIRVWDGSAWQTVGTASAVGSAGATGPTGPTGVAGSTGAMGPSTETLLSTTNLSGASTTISGISQAYTHLKITITGVTNGTANGYNLMKPNGTSTIANITHIIQGDPDFSGGFYNVGALTDFRLNGRTTIDRTSANNYCEIIIKNYSSTTLHKGIEGTSQWLPGSFAYMSEIKHGSFNITAAISSLVFSNTAGSHTSGTVRVYGLN